MCTPAMGSSSLVNGRCVSAESKRRFTICQAWRRAPEPSMTPGSWKRRAESLRGVDPPSSRSPRSAPKLASRPPRSFGAWLEARAHAGARAGGARFRGRYGGWVADRLGHPPGRKRGGLGTVRPHQLVGTASADGQALCITPRVTRRIEESGKPVSTRVESAERCFERLLSVS